MNTEVALELNNLIVYLEHLRDRYKLKYDEVWEDVRFKKKVDQLWKDLVEDFGDQAPEKEIYETTIQKAFRKAEPTKIVAVDYRLENWLDQAKRNYEEKLFKFYLNELRGEGKQEMIPQLEADTFQILDKCHDPREVDKEWDRRGLVYGHVQSGKTANYLALVHRAIDAGYKIVIILTGVNEDLRVQTQRRLDKYIDNYRGQNPEVKIRKATTVEFDLTSDTIIRLNADLNSDETSIWVIKKNKAILENLILWLDSQRIKQESRKIFNAPTLIIDDEADNASIQSLTKREFEEWEVGVTLDNYEDDALTEEQAEELDKARKSVIKTINRYIRVVLSLLANKSFVAYTATPYSVINQSFDDITGRTTVIKQRTFHLDDGDLFPEHFIIPLTAGDRYFGLDRMFNTSKELNIPSVIDINSKFPHENLNSIYPTRKGKSYGFIHIPDSLVNAILDFLISIVVKRKRGLTGHNTMLIHTSYLTREVDYTASKVENFLRLFFTEIKQEDSRYLKLVNKRLRSLKKEAQNTLYQKYFFLTPSFPDIVLMEDLVSIYFDTVQKLNVVSYHSGKGVSHHNHSLDYEQINDEGELILKNYIVVGGNKLSRGLTLEGLTTSYFVRQSSRRDSLYQMGRWFGYRIGFEDLIRIYMPKNQIVWYKSIHVLETHLRDDFEINMARETPVLPKNAIIKLAISSDKLPAVSKALPHVCDPNKLRKTTKQLFDFTGPTILNRIYAKDKNQLDKNFEQAIQFIKQLETEFQHQKFNYSTIDPELHSNVSRNNISFIDIPGQWIINFLQNTTYHDLHKDEVRLLLDFIQTNEGKTKGWTVSMINRANNSPFEPAIKIGDITLSKSKLQPVNIDELEDWKYSRLIGGRATDTSFDLIDTKPIVNETDMKRYRTIERRPLLLIYPIEVEHNSIIYKFPIPYIFYPDVQGIQKTNYTVRKKYNERI